MKSEQIALAVPEQLKAWLLEAEADLVAMKARAEAAETACTEARLELAANRAIRANDIAKATHGLSQQIIELRRRLADEIWDHRNQEDEARKAIDARNEKIAELEGALVADRISAAEGKAMLESTVALIRQHAMKGPNNCTCPGCEIRKGFAEERQRLLASIGGESKARAEAERNLIKRRAACG